MAIDNDLFLYNFAVVSIMKNEAPYVKEWLDYHILAGVDHFYIYDNDSPDNLKEILQPYIRDGLVTYIFYPGKARQYEAYNEAIQKYKFFCKYMAFIDADEFIFPQNNKSVLEVTEEILEKYPQAGGIAVNIFYFGSNNLKKADYSKGVLERFTRRAPTDWCPPMPELGNLPGGTAHVSSIVNPRRVHHFGSPHFAYYFESYYAINSNGVNVPLFYNDPPTVDKIVMNHYSVKSKEEYLTKISRGTADNRNNIYNLEKFKKDDHNEVFDDSILKYRKNRSIVKLENNATKNQRVYLALVKNLSPFCTKDLPLDLYRNRIDLFLACRKISEYMQENVLNDIAGKFFVEISLYSISKTLETDMKFSDFKLLLAELPEILKLNYPTVENVRKTLMNFLPSVMEIYRTPNIEGWKFFMQYQYILKMLQAFDPNKN